MLQIYDVILGVVRDLKPVMTAIAQRDPDLARQMRRAASSVALNTAEGMYSGGRNKGARYQNALGSMRETLACVEVGTALGYVDAIDAGLEDRIRKIIGTPARLIAR
jgi:four helix bundle protein